MSYVCDLLGAMFYYVLLCFIIIWLYRNHIHNSSKQLMVGSQAVVLFYRSAFLDMEFCDEFGSPVFAQDNRREDVVVNSPQWGLLPSSLCNKSWALVVSRRAHCRHDATLNRHFAPSISSPPFTQMDRH